MISRWAPIVVVEVGLSCVLASPASTGAAALRRPPETAPALRVQARPSAPGDVIVLTVIASRPLDASRVDVFDHVVPMWSTASATRWVTVIGVDVETKPGRYPLTVRGLATTGEPVTVGGTLTVTSKAFGTRRLLVEPKFSEPPASERARIAAEARRLGALFSASAAERYWRPPFQAPVGARASSPFGVRSVFNGQPRSRHNGVDFASPAGDPVHAPGAGRVVLAEPLYFTGNTVLIDHGQGLYSLLAHLSRMVVKSDDVVARNDIVGYVGATGRATGPHLHWTVRLQGARVDPLLLVSRTRALSR